MGADVFDAEVARRNALAQNPASTSVPMDAAPASGPAVFDAEVARREGPQPDDGAGVSTAGLAARTGINGAVGLVMGLPAMAYDAAAAPFDLIDRGINWGLDKAGVDPRYRLTEPFSMQSKNIPVLADTINKWAGTPEPVTPQQKTAVNIGSAALSALGPGGYARAVADVPAIAPIATRMASTPVMDAASGAGAEIGHEVASSNGNNPNTAGGAAGQFGWQTLGTMAPWIAAMFLRKAVTPNETALTPEQQAQIQTLDDAGVNLSAGQRTGNQGLITKESVLSNDSNSFYRNNPQANYGQLTQAALRRAGSNGAAATSDVLNAARAENGAEIGQITDRIDPMIDGQLRSDLNDVRMNHQMNLPANQQVAVQQVIDQLIPTNANRVGAMMSQTPNPVITRNLNPAAIPSRTYQLTRTDLNGRISDATTRQDTDLRNAWMGIKDALDDAADRTLRATRPDGADLAADLAAARQRYANLMTVEDAVIRSGAEGAGGIITPQALANAGKAAVGKRNYARGFGDMTDLSTAAQSLMRKTPSSGSAERLSEHLGLGGKAAAAGYVGYEAGNWLPTGHYTAPLMAAYALARPTVRAFMTNSALGQLREGNQLLPGPQPFSMGAPINAAVNPQPQSEEDVRRQMLAKMLGQ